MKTSTTEKIQKNDFIELEFTARLASDNQIFDTTDPKEAKQLGISKPEVKPLIISVGNQMLIKGLDEALLNKEVNKKYTITLTPEKAFGKRDSRLIKTYSLAAFKKQSNLDLYPGMLLQLDNLIAKVLSVSGGRVMLDFNNPLAGKEVKYTFKILRKITNLNEKINALQEFFFNKKFDFTIDTKNKRVIFKNKNAEPFLKIFAPKFEKIIKMKFEVEKKN